MKKDLFIAHLKRILSEKIQLLQNEIEQLRIDIASDSKSTAGDKHETSRAMAQLEMEKLGKQVLDYQKQLQWIQQLNPEEHTSTKQITTGSLIRLSNGWYFLGPGIGKIDYKKDSVFCLSIQSPLGQQLLDKKIGQVINLPNLNLKIEFIS